MRQSEAVCTHGGRRLFSMVRGVVIGAAAMYFLDPDRGRARRALLRTRLAGIVHRARAASGVIARDLANRARGLFAETRGALTEGVVDDDVLCERIRSKMGRALPHAHHVSVEARSGTSVLSGIVDARDADELVRAVSHVRGVRSIEDHLDRRTHDAPS